MAPSAHFSTETRSLAGASASLEFWGSAATCPIITLHRSTAAREGHRTVIDALIPFVGALFKATKFADAVEACKVGREGTAGLTAKLGRARYATDTGNLPPDSGAMSLVVLTKGMMEGLAWEADKV